MPQRRCRSRTTTIAMPFLAAWFSVGHSADGSLAAMTMASALAWMAAWIDGICAAAVSCGAAADDDLAAEFGQRLLAALVGQHLVRVLRVLGDEVDLQALLHAARGAAIAGAAGALLRCVDVEPHAVSMPPTSRAASGSGGDRPAVRVRVMCCPFSMVVTRTLIGSDADRAERVGQVRPGGRRRGPGPAAGGAPPHRWARSTLISSSDAGDDVLLVRRDVHLGQGHLQAADDGDRQHDAGDRAATAEDRDAAEEHDRDDVQLEAGAGAVADRRVLHGEQDAGERADHAGDDEQPRT